MTGHKLSGKPARHPLRTAVIFLVFLLLLLSASLAALIHYREMAALFAANRLLAPYGIELLAIRDISLSRSSLSIDEIRFHYPGDSREQEVRGLHISFTGDELLSGRLQAIIIREADILLPALREDTAPTGSFAMPGPEQLQQILRSLPLAQLQIEHLTLHSVTGPLLEADITLQARTDQLLFKADSLLHAELSPFLALMMKQDLPIIGGPIETSLSLSVPLTASASTQPPDPIQVTVVIPAGQHLVLREFAFLLPAGDIPEARIVLNSPLHLIATLPFAAAITANNISVKLEADSLDLQLPLIRLQEQLSSVDFQLRQFSLKLSPAFTLETAFSVPRMTSQLLPYDLGSARLQGQLQVDANSVRLDGDSRLNGQQLVVFQLHHDLEQNQGEGRIELPGLVFDSLWSRLSDFIKPLPLPLDMLAGTVSGSAMLSWQADPTTRSWQFHGPVTLRAEDLSGFYQETGFVGLSTEVSTQLSAGNQWQLLAPVSLHLASLDPGIPINNISALFSFDPASGKLEAQHASAGIFGGTVSGQNLEFDLTTLDGHIPLTLENIDLSQILALNAYRGVSASGLISGQLPIVLQHGQARIDSGLLHADSAGGNIQYRPDGNGGKPPDTGNASLDLVYQALSNYHYDTLQASVDYQDSGELNLSIGLQGLNPEMNGGQRINLNLNITDNIPALLQSLQSGRTIAEELIKRL